MAVPKVEVDAMWNGDDLKQGTEESARALEDLARETDYAADKMNTALKSVDDGVRTSLGSGGSLDQATTSASADLQSFADNAKEEVPGAMLDMQDGVQGAAQGLAAALAPMGPGGLVIATVLAGFTIMKNRADAAAQAMRDSVNTAIGSIEVKARTTNAAIEKMYERQLNFESTLEKFGDGDATKGYEKLAGYADTLGVETEDIVAFIQGRHIPAAQRVADLIKLQGDNLKDSGDRMRENWGVLTDQETVAGALNKYAEEERQVREKSLAIERDARDALQDMRDFSWDTYDAVKATRYEMQEMERAASRIGGDLGNAVRQAGLLDLALNGVTD